MPAAPTRPGRARTVRRRVTARSSVIALLLLLLACSVSDAPPEGEDDLSNGSAGGELTCPEPVLAGIEQTIGSQLDAFAADDIASAFSQASEAFQAQTDLASFERLITEAFPAVADPQSFAVDDCRSEQGSAQVVVAVVGADGGRMSLVYLMVEESGRWAIDGARAVGSDPGLVA